ncbi:MAG: hypothetical protein BGO41_00380 [Clostridiales bacterium 38-18]|nr:MAG: hypothetical protein BGO41_00380 [Clostridiales bacterium 38-18]
MVRPNIVISKCIEHGHCRYDGSQINDSNVKQLMAFVNFIPLCPEMAIGLPSPRQSLRMVEKDQVEKLVFSLSGEEVTHQMKAYALDQVQRINQMDVDGFLLKSKSPSCGIKDVKVYQSHGKVPKLPKKTKGIFGSIILEQFESLAVEDEGRLLNYNIREQFYTRIFTHARYREVIKENNHKSLVAFHSNHKYLLMAYNQNQLTIMGRIVANHEHLELKEVLVKYGEALDKALKTPVSSSRNINVILHIFGYFSKHLNTKEKAYFLDTLEHYRNKQLPLSSVMSILSSWVARFEMDYLENQVIFAPFPEALINVTDSGKGL